MRHSLSIGVKQCRGSADRELRCRSAVDVQVTGSGSSGYSHCIARRYERREIISASLSCIVVTQSTAGVTGPPG